MPRFVLLYHECPPGYERPSHWDFMLEAGDTLRTWALAELPSPWKAAQLQTQASHPDCPALSAYQSVEAQLLGNHRRDYLEFEGGLSGNRGAVTRIDAGVFTIAGAAQAELQIELRGIHLRGRSSLVEISSGSEAWMLNCEADG